MVRAGSSGSCGRGPNTRYVHEGCVAFRAKRRALIARLRLILGDQLSPGLSSLADADKEADLILLAEVAEEAGYVAHHKQKIAFLFASMRHFARELRDEGYRVRYVAYDDEANSGSLLGEVKRAVADEGPFEGVILTKPGEYRLWAHMETWSKTLGLPVDLREDDRFFCTLADFRDWAAGRKTLRMEDFYREMRKRTGFLMEGQEPCGGAWNYDKENRKALPADFQPPKRYRPQVDDVTQEVLDLVARTFPDHPGALEGFRYATRRDKAERALEAFMADCLPHFGDYQDAMAAGEPYLFHAHLSAYLNAGLLDPYAVCARAEEAYREGHAPLNAVEGFIRQVLGWREYVRGLYWLKMPDYADGNHFNATRPLPGFFWDADTDMACLREAIGQTLDNAYAHHIQRLMVIGNFALLAGLAPAEVEAWYLAVYADAYEWVELPNTHGMALYADGGMMASKPYAASGNYIARMSDYCSGCAYDVRRQTEENACPFNALYWDFIARHHSALKSNHRMGVILKQFDKMAPAKREALRGRAKAVFATLDCGAL